MKKLIVAAVLFVGITAAHAQTTHGTEKVEVSKTSTLPEKVHNVVDPKHKEYSGYKVKKKTPHGKKYVKTVDKNDHTVTIKTKNSGSMDKKVVTTSTK